MGVGRDLAVRATLAVPREITEQHRCVLLLSSLEPDQSSRQQRELLQLVA
jgi:hypothetical protein